MVIQPEVPPEYRSCGRCRHARELGFALAFAYQPIVDLAGRTVFGYEALVRGPRGESAWSVLSQVNETNRYEFDQACRIGAIKGAAALGIRERLSINFIPNAVYHPATCIQSTFNAARESGFPPENLIFEVTEGERVRDRPHLVNIFREYRNYGFSTAIDDFGAGYAGLGLLSEYQPTILKIDMALVRGVDRDRMRQAIVKGVMAMCRDMGVQVLAEGVETVAERDVLAEAGVGLMQGFLFSKPMLRSLGEVRAEAWH
ncbi:EAL domain-containing protein [Massilia niastensis]|uniref:EAL domain-containing protein n=1 Tax=Massilia niastensis TaxID=544911 RepID=UPI0003723CCE|nr:EAL domain-containing protein [Massilia niastensis]